MTRTWLLSPVGALCLTLVLMGIAWAENAAAPWTPFYGIYVVLTIAVPLVLRAGRFGSIRAVRGRDWLRAVGYAVGGLVVLGVFTALVVPPLLAVAGVSKEAAQSPSWNLAAAHGLLFERLAPHWRMDAAGMRSSYLAFLLLWAGFGEEVYFRGYLHRAFGERWRFGAVAVVSALLFGLRHATQLAFLGSEYPWGAAVVWVSCGLLFGLALSDLYRRTGSLWPPIAAHYLFNLPSLAA